MPILRRSHGLAGFSLIETLMVAMLLAICAVTVTSTWQVCYSMNSQTRRMQAAKNALEQEMERGRRLNWLTLPEQTGWATRQYYDRNGNPTASAVTPGLVSYIKVETLNGSATSLAQATALDATGGTSRSLRRITIRLQPTGSAADAASPAAEAFTYLTLGGP
jgi:type II secretory pathway pseudopilin PulG